MNNKTCAKCKKELQVTEFWKRSASKNGYQSRCKQCMDQYRISEDQRKKRSLRTTSWRRRNPKNAGLINKRYLERHRDQRRAYDREYRRNHAEKKYSMCVRWIKRHPEKRSEYGNRRRAVKIKTPGFFTAQEFQALKVKYGYQCLGCGRPEQEKIKLVVDHIIPMGQEGSTNWIGNIQPLCRSCNNKKRSKIIDYRPQE